MAVTNGLVMYMSKCKIFSTFNCHAPDTIWKDIIFTSINACLHLVYSYCNIYCYTFIRVTAFRNINVSYVQNIFSEIVSNY